MPPGFTWVERPALAALAQPEYLEELLWLRDHGIDVLVSLTEYAPPRSWVNEAGLFSVHVPVADLTAPSQRQIETCLAAIRNARSQSLGVAVHCAAGKGRTGTVLATYFVSQGMTAAQAISHVRQLRPGSIETRDQEDAVTRFAREFTKPAESH